MMEHNENVYLGFDVSTQGIKAVAVVDTPEGNLSILEEYSISFDSSLPHYKTKGGVYHHKALNNAGEPAPEEITVTAPVAMWVEGLDLLLDKMAKKEFPFHRVACISGSAQQHGTVYWSKRFSWTNKAKKTHGKDTILEMLLCDEGDEDTEYPFLAQAEAPVWMDSSTSDQCDALASTWGAQWIAEVTGSRPYERFSGPQIAKIIQEKPTTYRKTQRISLVSSFIASLFIGDYAPIDYSDGSEWSDKMVEAVSGATSPALLRAKLGKPAESHTIVGTVASYLVRRYCFLPSCLVAAFSGDNPCSLAGMRLSEQGNVAVSLGTSDTVMASLATPIPNAEQGHIFRSPIDPKGFMALLCFKNGASSRALVKDSCASGSWSTFNEILRRTPPCNRGHIGLYYIEPEITPPLVTGIFRFAPDGTPVKRFSPETEVRAVIESQFLSMKLHMEKMGLSKVKRLRRCYTSWFASDDTFLARHSVLATGGASENTHILKVLADVFGVPVYRAKTPNSAALGAAYRAYHATRNKGRTHFLPFSDALRGRVPPFEKVHDANADAHSEYCSLLTLFKQRQTTVCAGEVHRSEK